MDEIIYTLDPEGDVILVLYNVPENLPRSMWDIDASTLAGFSNVSMHFEPVSEPPPDIRNLEEENGIVELDHTEGTNTFVDSSQDHQHAEHHLQIRASSKHLALACPQFKRTLQHGFQEGDELKSKGYLELPVQDWPALPFLILAMIIHGRTRTVPREISLERLAEIALLVDYYECYEAVEVFSDLWINSLAKTPLESVCAAEKWLFISWGFQQDMMFERSSKYLQLSYRTNITSIQYPIPSSVRGKFTLIPTSPLPSNVKVVDLKSDAINVSREDAIKRLIECIYNLWSRLQSSTARCSYECDCMLLGALTKQMHEMDILSPRPKSEFPGICFNELASQCCYTRKPQWYGRKSNVSHSCSLSSSLAPLVGSLKDSLTGLDISSFVQLRRPGHPK